MSRSPLVVSVILLYSWLETPAEGAEQFVTVGYRFLGAPDFLLDSTFSLHQPVLLNGGTVEYGRGNLHSHWMVGLGVAWSSIRDGNWQLKGGDPETTSFLEWNVGFVGMWVGRRWNLKVTEALLFSPALAAGAAAVVGEVFATEMIPGCSEPAVKCGHWSNVTRHPIEFSYRVLPIVVASASLTWQFSSDLAIMLDGGVLDLPFVGLSLVWNVA